jgi:hypothetical protein
MNDEWAAHRYSAFTGTHTVAGWRLRTYVVSARGDGVAQEQRDAAVRALGDCVPTTSSDPDYTLFRTGVAVVHFGRRGVTVTLAHFGLWGDMFEVFLRGWYRTAGQVAFESLTSVDPVLCYHDIPVLLADVALARSKVAAAASEPPLDWADVMASYISATPVSPG